MGKSVITLFKGDNGEQEFWEDKESKILILRLKEEKLWTAMLNYRVMDGVAGTLADVKNAIEEKLDILCSLNPSKMWKTVEGAEKMELQVA